ncbi:MAG: hypothetical protein AB7U73_03140 [Pirellulales bacterium]
MDHLGVDRGCGSSAGVPDVDDAALCGGVDRRVPLAAPATLLDAAAVFGLVRRAAMHRESS